MKDTTIARLIRAEEERAKGVINLIASENKISHDVSVALASEFGNKYSEGYPGHRYYGGNVVVDQLETLCQERALELFKLSEKKWHVNVQPHSGSPANLSVISALVPPGGTIMGLSLAHGGHLTHGHSVSLTGKLWRQVPYTVSAKTERIDYDEVLRIAQKERPDVIIAGFTAYARRIDWKKFRKIADDVGAYLMVDMSHIAGLVAGGSYPSPFPYADVVTTTTHKTLRGPRGAMIFVRKDSRELSLRIDKMVFPGLQGGPHENAIAGIAVALKEARSSSFRRYTEKVIANAQLLSSELKRLGWRIVSGGTDSHLFLVDTWMNGSGISGKEASDRLERSGIIVNMNTIPFDTRTPRDPSGIRIGTAYATTCGMSAKSARALAKRIDEILRASE